jgi:dUTP pyrophosphatase
VKILVQKTHPNAKTPVLGKYEGDAGVDVYCAEAAMIRPDRVTRIPLGIRVKLPEGTWMEFRPRSSATQKGISLSMSTIDEGYVGELYLFCYSIGGEQRVRCGDKIAQMVLHRTVAVQEVECVEVLPETHRGVAGFGSSGV